MAATDPRVIGGRYEIVRLVGKGGMGEVYEATDTQARRRVAVKLLALERARPEAEEEAAKRFTREIKAMAQVSSRHVVAVHDAGVDDDTGRPFMVMDYLEGEDLESIAERVGALKVDTALRLIAQACDGLAAAHAAGIVHRDVKPSNLFLVAAGASGGRIVKILDFGIARMRAGDLEAAPTALTMTGAIIGSPLYMAPEQLRGTRELDHRADVWSLGVVAYRLLAGTVPHHGFTIADVLITVCSEPAPPLRERAPWVPEEVAALVHRALQIDASARTPSARAFADELRPLLRDGTTTVNDDMLVSEGTPTAVRTAARAATPLPMPTSTTITTRPPEPQGSAVRSPTALVAGLALAAVLGVGAYVWHHTRAVEREERDEALETGPPVTPAPTLLPAPPPPPGPEPIAPSHPPSRPKVDLPVEYPARLAGWLTKSPEHEWWIKARRGCSPAHYRDVLAGAPATRAGVTFAIACAGTSGDLAWARKQLAAAYRSKAQPATSALASYASSWFAHRTGDLTEDATAYEIATLVLEYTPDNPPARYAAGVYEFELGRLANARTHLLAFLGGPLMDRDKRVDTAHLLLDAIGAPQSCSGELHDHRGKKIFRHGC